MPQEGPAGAGPYGAPGGVNLLSGVRAMFMSASMALLIAPEGPLRDALRAAFEAGEPRSAPFDHPDLFGAAVGAGAIVYAPASPADPERMRRVLGAANAPGVTLLIVVRPPGDDFEPEERLLRRDGKPFVVLAAPEGSPELGTGLRRALREGELQGRVVELAAFAPPSAEAAFPRTEAKPPSAEATPAGPKAAPSSPKAAPSGPKAAPSSPAKATAPATRAQPTTPNAPQEPPSTRRWAVPALVAIVLLAAAAVGMSVLQNGCSGEPEGAPPVSAAREATVPLAGGGG